MLICNTASECGYTEQYLQLQRLHRDYARSSLVVIGMPCNDFGAQEPGTEAEIEALTHDKYGVEFPVTSKIHILGQKAHPLFLDMLDTFGDDILPRWNFHKYLFAGSGELVDSWPARVKPDDPLITHQVERQLNAWVL